MIEEELSEEADGVIRLHLEGFGQGLGEHEADLILLQVCDIRVLLVKQGGRRRLAR